MIKVNYFLASLMMPLMAFAQKSYDIRAYGAKTDRSFLNTVAIQHTIDAAALAGGGRVLIPDGYFLTGPLFLKTGVELHFSDDAVLLGSANRLDYTDPNNLSLINARDQQHIAITGHGEINGQGRELVNNVLYLLGKGVIQDSQWKIKRPGEKNRPTLISFIHCQDIKVSGITLKDASGWVQSYNRCSDVVIDHMNVQSTAYWNNDGIDIVDSHHVRITNSVFNAADDAICLKSEDAKESCDDIVVENCTLRSSASGFKLGTGSLGAFRHVKVNYLFVYDTYRSAIALETVDGAVIEDIDIRNVTATNTGNAIFLRLGHRNKDERYGSLKKVYIGHVKVEIPSGKPDLGYPVEGPLPKIAAHNLVPASIVGLPGHPVKDVTLEDIELIYGGGGRREIAYQSTDRLNEVTENESGYPEFTMFGELPSWGLYVRHVGDLKLNNIRFSLQSADFRPALVFDDVNNLSLNQVTVPADATVPAIINHQVTGFTSQGLKIPGDSNTAIVKK